MSDGAVSLLVDDADTLSQALAHMRITTNNAPAACGLAAAGLPQL